MRRTAFSTLSYLLCLAFFMIAGLFPRTTVAADMGVGSNFWFSWRGDSYTDPFTSNANFAAYPSHGDVWRPEFISEIAPYKILRFMDWNCTNNQTLVTWSQRRLATSTAQEGAWNGNMEYEWTGSGWALKNPPGTAAAGIAYEYQIELCNRLDKDIWICIPHKVDDNYVTQLARLLRDTVETGRTIYVEYSNEVWNSGFDQQHWCQDRGVAQGLGTGYEACSKYYGKRVGQIMAIFQTEFSGQTSRLVRILAAQPGDTYHVQLMWDQMMTTSGRVDALAIAPYFGRDVNGNDANVIALLNASINAEVTNSVVPSKNWANGKSIKLVAYEGGQHIYTAGADVASRNPQMYDVYQNYLNSMNPYFDVFNHYAHASSYNSTGAWGAKEGIGQAESSAHKYRSIKNWISAHSSNQVAAPSFSPAPGTYTSAQNVTISTSTSGATIRYTTNGTNPTSTSGTIYSGPVSIAVTTTLKAIAYKSGMTDSTVTTGVYTINTGGGGGTFTLNPTADMSSQGDTAGTSATPPVSQWANLYMKFSLTSVTGTPVSNAKLRVYRNDTSAGALTVSVYQCTTDSWSEGGTLPAMGSLITTSASNNAVGYIELDCTSFVNSQYTGDKVVTLVLTTSSGSWTNFTARESASNKPQLVVTTNGGTVAAPSFSPAPGTYTSAQNVTITTSTSGASIRYTTDGSTPTSTSGTVYSGPVNISTTKTLKAIAYKSGMTDSTVTSGLYTINLGGTFTLNPTADMASQGDTAGTAVDPPASLYSTYYLKFSLTSVTGSTVSNAKLRIYRNDTGAGSITINCLQGSSDSWSEGGTLPGTGSTITSVTNNALGYVEFTVTSFVQSQYTGDKTVTLAVTTSSGAWTRFASREAASNKPQLVVTTN